MFSSAALIYRADCTCLVRTASLFLVFFIALISSRGENQQKRKKRCLPHILFRIRVVVALQKSWSAHSIHAFFCTLEHKENAERLGRRKVFSPKVPSKKELQELPHTRLLLLNEWYEVFVRYHLCPTLSEWQWEEVSLYTTLW